MWIRVEKIKIDGQRFLTPLGFTMTYVKSDKPTQEKLRVLMDYTTEYGYVCKPNIISNDEMGFSAIKLMVDDVQIV